MPRSVPFSFIILAAMVWWTGGAVFIPDSFTTKDLAAYTIRYLSMDGKDTEVCLSNPANVHDLYQVNASTVQYCRSLLYALTGGNSSLPGNDSISLIILVLPGTYLLGERGVTILDYGDVILSKMPNTSGEVVFTCNEFNKVEFNNLYFNYTRNVVLNELVFTECGPHISPVNIQEAVNVTVSYCVFR